MTTVKDINGTEIKVGDTVERVSSDGVSFGGTELGHTYYVEALSELDDGTATIKVKNIEGHYLATKFKVVSQGFSFPEDLKTGMIVENRIGDLAMVLRGTEHGDIISGYTWKPLCDIDCGVSSKYAILKVYQPNSNREYLVRSLTKNHPIIWEREEETPEQKRIKELEEGISKMQCELNKLL